MVGPVAKTADAADASLQAADSIKPFDQQLSNLNAFATQEDLAVATVYVARRDKVVADVLQGSSTVDNLACARLGELTRQQICDEKDGPASDAKSTGETNAAIRLLAGFSRIYADGSEVEDGYLSLAASHRSAYERVTPAESRAKDDCKSLLAKPVDPAAAVDLITTRDACGKAKTEADKSAALAKTVSDLGATGAGSHVLTSAYQDWQAAASKTEPNESDPALVAIDGQMKLAKDLANGGAVATLAQFQTAVEGDLQNASAAVKVLGWTVVQTQLDGFLQATVCSGAATPPAQVAAAGAKPADCSKLDEQSEAGRAAAVWRLLQALGQVADANDPRMRSANWIAAASAIARAEKADAQILADADKAVETADFDRFLALAREASLLAATREAISNPQPCAKAVTAEACAKRASGPALATYIASWNSGRIPAEVLANRKIQYQRSTSVQRWKAAASEQRSLMLAASGSIKAYADGGIQPSTIAQVIFDLSLIGATAAK